MNSIGPTNNDFLNYLSWCEANDIEPFPNGIDIGEENDEIEDIDEEGKDD